MYGDGPLDLVYGRSSVSHIELVWDEPHVARFFKELGTFCRVILWDKRGVGLSDRSVGTPTLEDRMDDVRAVMDAAGCPRAVIFGASDTAAMSLLFAATYPERTAGLILIAPLVRGVASPDYPWVPSRDEVEKSIQQADTDWGSQDHIDRVIARLAPSRIGDESFKQWFGRVVRFASSPSADAALARMNMEIDVRAALPAVHVPTLVLQCREDRFVRPENAEYVASHIDGARLVTVPGIDHMFWANPQAFTVAITAQREFIRGLPGGAAEEDRVLLTVLFIDIVGSTQRAVSMGDRAWGALVEQLFGAAEGEVKRFRGRIVKHTGDGLLAVFDGPTRGVRCARALQEGAQGLGIGLRTGLHTGECQALKDDVVGSAVNIAARICDRAAEGEVLTSRTVRDLCVGSDLKFAPREPVELKGLDGRWELFSVPPT